MVYQVAVVRYLGESCAFRIKLYMMSLFYGKNEHRWKDGQRLITTELAPGPYFPIIKVHLEDLWISVFAKFDEIPSLVFQDIKERPKRHRRMDGLCKCSVCLHCYIMSLRHLVKCQIVSAKAVVRADFSALCTSKIHFLRITKGNNSNGIGPYPISFYYKCSSCGFQCVCKIWWNSIIACSRY